MGRRRCRVCGCTDHDACTVLDVPCCWVGEELCSACAPLGQLLESEDAGLPWLITVMGEYFGRQLLPQMEVPVPVIWRDEA
jgi:hypothetical protein